MKRNIFGIIIILSFLGCKSGSSDFDANGSFEAVEIIVSSEASGKIVTFNLTEGDLLKENQIVGCVDTVQLYLSRLLLEANQKTVLSRKTDISIQIASIQEQIRNQESEKIRFEYLVKSDAGTQKQVDDITAQILILERQLTAQKTAMQTSNLSIENEYKALEIQIAQINDKIEKSLIKSPIDGTVLVKYSEKGELTQMGKPLFKIADTENMFLKAYVTADQLSRIKTGQNVKVSADFGKDGYRDYDGVITWISDKSEFTPKNILTKDERANLVYAIKVAVKNDGYLKIGMYGQMTIGNN